MEEEVKKKVRITDVKIALRKAESYCAYQERAQQEVRDKLYEWGLWPEAVEDIIAKLITGNFVNEERFAKAFAGGKFRIKKWGRVKIKIELKKRKISDYCIKQAMQEIDNKEYIKILKKTIESQKEKLGKKKLPRSGPSLSGKGRYASEIIKQKIIQYCLSRGFERDIVMDELSQDREKK